MERRKIGLQIRINDEQMEDEVNTGEETMNLVMQFGYVCLFSNVFPLASFFAWLANFMTYHSILQEFRIKRRSIPEVSLGIGIYTDLLEILSQSAVFLNVAICYFTSDNTINLLLGWSNKTLTPVQTLMIFVGVEHLIYALKVLIRIFSKDTEDRFLDAQRVNEIHIEKYDQMKSLLMDDSQKRAIEAEAERRLRAFKREIGYETASEKARKEEEEAARLAQEERDR